MTFKSWKSFDEQLDILIRRGMVVDDRMKALNYLEKIGYYRLSGYWYPFRRLKYSSGNTGKKSCFRCDEFIENSRFGDIVSLYIFDKKLRLLALDALERIEMAMRVDIAHLLGAIDTHAHEKPQCFCGHFSKQIQCKGKAKGQTRHQQWLKRYDSHLQRSREMPFVKHYLDKYGKLPIWVAAEIWDFGMMSKLFSGMKPDDQNQIAAKYGAPNGRTLAKWLRSFNFMRNVSAHHGRLWNINVVERSKTLSDDSYWKALDNSRPFFYFCLMQRLMQIICPHSTWYLRFKDLTKEFPQVPTGAARLNDSGIINDWESWELWNETKRKPTRTQKL